jgi:hypothetical protein
LDRDDQNSILIMQSKVISDEENSMEETVEQKLARLEEENKALKQRKSGQLYLKVSEKGGLSVYGLGRFPVTLYKEQWRRLLDFTNEIRTFLQENDHLLKGKE